MNFISSQQLMAFQLLPVSSNGLTIQKGDDIRNSASTPHLPVASLIDFARIWMMKKKAKANSAIYLVNPTYISDGGFGNNTLGLTVDSLHVSAVTAIQPDTMTHEMLHSLTSKPHSNIELTEGINVAIQTAWTNGKILDSTKVPFAVAYNAFSADGGAADAGANVTIDNDTYSKAFETLIAGTVDPKVILVSGVIDSKGHVLYNDFDRAEVLNEGQMDSTITINGFDVKDKIVSTIKTGEINRFNLFSSKGSSAVVTSGYMFAAALPDTGNIAHFEIMNGKTLILRQFVPLRDLSSLINNVSAASFKDTMRASAQKKLMMNTYLKYVSDLKSQKLLAADESLLMLNVLADFCLKPKLVFVDGTTMDLKDFTKLVDQDLVRLKNECGAKH